MHTLKMSELKPNFRRIIDRGKLYNENFLKTKKNDATARLLGVGIRHIFFTTAIAVATAVATAPTAACVSRLRPFAPPQHRPQSNNEVVVESLSLQVSRLLVQG